MEATTAILAALPTPVVPYPNVTGVTSDYSNCKSKNADLSMKKYVKICNGLSHFIKMEEAGVVNHVNHKEGAQQTNYIGVYYKDWYH